MEAQDIVIDTTKYSSSYKSAVNSVGKSRNELRIALAEANNCVAIGDASCYAAMVGIPREYPDVVIKICDKSGDAFIDFAYMIFKGVIKSVHYPIIYSAAEISEGVHLFVMERLTGSCKDRYNEVGDWQGREPGYDRFQDKSYWISDRVTKLFNKGMTIEEVKTKLDDTELTDTDILLAKALGDIKAAFADAYLNACIDCHTGNLMYRADGTLVLLDPVC